MSVLIFSELGDRTANEVERWLHRWAVSCTRINREDHVQVAQLSLHEGIALVEVNGQLVDLYQFNAVWHRRGFLRPPDIQAALQTAWNRYGLPMEAYFEREWRILRDYIMQVVRPARQLGNFEASTVNKLHVLDLAAQCELQTPATHVSQCAERLKKIVAKQEHITKPIGEVLAYSTGDALYQSFTEPCSERDFDQHLQFPALVQEKIDKWCELRIFILLDQCYAMAIFSQNDVHTAMDYRNFSHDNKPRMVPFVLPHDVRVKLLKLNNMLNLNTSSVDMIVTHDLQYIFLELNPVGNIEMLSKPCNYHIERRIAQFLAHR